MTNYADRIIDCFNKIDEEDKEYVLDIVDSFYNESDGEIKITPKQLNDLIAYLLLTNIRYGTISL